ncbi:hypothetical protein ACFQ7F_13640 [Streptomyces sp. NPDC056486]|uniref:hypothetical protein n=1 Tax=Streptomyces sp. NPDC056486 TaxID=3345835 RepID=UPI003696BCAE
MDANEPYKITWWTGDTPSDQLANAVKRWLSTPKRDLEDSVVVHTAMLSVGVDIDLVIADGQHRYVSTSESFANEEATARRQLRAAADALKSAVTASQRRVAVRNFLSALAELFLCLLRFVVRVLLALLSLLLGRGTADDASDWTSDLIDATPRATPRGPTFALPVLIHRGGHHSSRALGSAVLAA